jgi:hypothetical protein
MLSSAVLVKLAVRYMPPGLVLPRLPYCADIASEAMREFGEGLCVAADVPHRSLGEHCLCVLLSAGLIGVHTLRHRLSP